MDNNNSKKDPSLDSSQTAYDEAPQKRSLGEGQCLQGWDKKIIQLYSDGYSYLGFRFSDPGYLFRGASCGLRDLVMSECFGYYQGDRSVSVLEQQLGIYFLTQDLSDAYAVARFWEIPHDGFIAVLKSKVFNQELEFGRAAVLGFAEPGVVFKYPFLTQPLSLEQIDYLIISTNDYAAIYRELDNQTGSFETEFGGALQTWKSRGDLEKFIVPEADSVKGISRSDFEKAMLCAVAECGILSALPQATVNYPSAENLSKQL